MIRFLQKDTRLVKYIFAAIICAAIIGMVLYLVPGIWDSDMGGANGTVFATVTQPGLWARITGQTTQIQTTDVNQLVQRQMAQQRQQLPASLMPLLTQRAGEYLVQQAILRQEADRLGLEVSKDDLVRELQTGELSQYLFPGGKFIGDDKYIDFVESNYQTSVADFEDKVREQMELSRLQAMVTGGVTVSDNTVRQEYLKQGTKVKFDYAVISSDDLRKQVNPSDADLQAYFKQNAARYANADPETRKIEYVSFPSSLVPNARPEVSDAEIEAYYNQHKSDYAQPEEVHARHILIAVPAGSDAKTDAAAKAKAEDVLKQLKAGGNFAELAKKYSDDPGSKENGGDLPMMPTSGFVPEFSKAAMALNPGQTSDPVKTQFGYHIIQTIAKQPAGTKPLAEVKDQIRTSLQQQKSASVLQSFQQQVTAQAAKDGLAKTAAAYHQNPVTTDFVQRGAQIAGLADSAALLNQAFQVNKGASPAAVSTGDGFALFQVVDVKPAHAPTFDEYKSHLLEDYRTEKTPQMLNAELQKLAGRAKVLNDLKKAAAEMNVPFKSSDLVGRDGQLPQLGAMTGPMSIAFTLDKGTISGPINTGTAGVVLTVVDKQQPTAEDIAKNFAQTRTSLLQQRQQEVFEVFAQSLIDRYQKAGGVRYSRQTPASPLSN
jgi:peptidyl-prolyl cis-trans isomerase D